jgi:transposase, IS5 family
VFRTVGGQPSLWESLLPPQACRPPEELERVDAMLDDTVLFGPFFDPRIGRPSTPMETYLRLMFLKFRYGHANRPARRWWYPLVVPAMSACSRSRGRRAQPRPFRPER